MLSAALGLALLASLAWGLADFLGGVASRKTTVLVALVLSQCLGMIPLVAGLLWRGGPFVLDPSSAAFAVAAGVASVVALGLFYLAMTMGRITVVAPIEACGVVVPVAVGLAGGDEVTLVAAAGMALAVVGVAAVAGGGGEDDEAGGHDNTRAALVALASAVAYGTFLTLLQRAAQQDALTATTVMRAASCVAVLGFLVVFLWWRRGAGRRPAVPAASASVVGSEEEGDDTGEDDGRGGGIGTMLRRSTWATWSVATIAVTFVVGFADAGAELLFATATASAGAQLSTVSVLSSLYPAVTMVLAVLLLRERPRPLQVLGALVAVVGVLLLAS